MENHSDNKEDIRILHSFLDGNENAFTFIYNKYVDELFSYGLGLGFERETLKDAIQDTFVKFFTHKRALKTVENLKYYLFRMLKNRLLDIYKLNKEDLLEDSELPFYMETTVLEDIIAEEEKKSLKHRVDYLLSLLTNRQKEAVYLRFSQEFEYEKIADLLDMTPSAVRKLISRAVKRMRKDDFQ